MSCFVLSASCRRRNHPALYTLCMKLLRLSGRKTCERVKTKGFLWKGKHFFVRYLHGAPRSTPAASLSVSAVFVGTLTSTKLDKSAVKRNRMRRRCREALRIILKGLSVAAGRIPRSQPNPRSLIPDPRSLISDPRFFQLLLLPRSSSLSADFGELTKDAEHLLASLLSRAR